LRPEDSDLILDQAAAGGCASARHPVGPGLRPWSVFGRRRDAGA